MRFIVTRPEPDCKSLVKTLRARGHDGVPAPLITIAINREAPAPPRDVQAVLVTSANAIRALPEGHGLYEVPVLAVGPASANAAREAGFQNVKSADGDLGALVQLSLKELGSAKGPVFYPSGETVSGDLKGRLEAKGFTCIRQALYYAVRASVLPPLAELALKNGTADGVLLFSPRTARIWADCLGRTPFADQAACLQHWCLSAAVAAALRDVWPIKSQPNIGISPDPDEISLLNAIDTAQMQ